jgi:hypothetical protein
LKNYGIEQMKKYGSNKSPFTAWFPQEGGHNQQIEQNTRNTNHPMDQRFLEQHANDGIGLFIFK